MLGISADCCCLMCDQGLGQVLAGHGEREHFHIGTRLFLIHIRSYLAVEGLGKYTAMASGIFMVMVCGGGILPLIQGGVADVTSSYMASFWVIFAGVAYMLYYALIGCKNVNKNIPVE